MDYSSSESPRTRNILRVANYTNVNVSNSEVNMNSELRVPSFLSSKRHGPQYVSDNLYQNALARPSARRKSGKSPREEKGMKLSNNSKFLTTNFMAFDVFTSVKGAGLMDDMVSKWYTELQQEEAECSMVPWKTIEAYFDSIPLVCAPTKESVADQFARYVHVMEQLKNIIRSAVYLTFTDEERTPYFVAHNRLKANFEALQSKYQRVILDHPDIPSDPMMRVVHFYWRLNEDERRRALQLILADLVQVDFGSFKHILLRTFSSLGEQEVRAPPRSTKDYSINVRHSAYPL